ITDAAAHWWLRLQSEDCTAVERQAYERWLAADPVHVQEYQAMLDIWQTADDLPRSAVPGTVISLPQRRGPRVWRNYASAAAIALVALPGGAWIGW
ncbi:FecR/PupR family sigma factor regulator, partial [Pseudomonas sp. BJa5]|uniref:FecR/PupR family sigma factor regulator n=1 Tax=Pseudomonas sp. BJa5 TaxID=2936270 RepID=UPI00255A105B